MTEKIKASVVSAVTEIIVTHPIDYVKTILQNNNINYKEESKVIKKEENKLEHSGDFLEKLNLENIKINFTKVFIEIIDDISELYKERCTRDCKDEDNFVNTFLFYFNNIIKIIVKEGRMFYMGILIIFLSLMLYFIDSTK